MKYLSIAILIISLASGCKLFRRQPEASRSDSHVSRDSTSDRQHVKTSDSTLYSEKLREEVKTIPGDSSKVSTQIKTNDSGFVPLKIKTEGSRSSLEINIDRKGNLRGKCECKQEKAIIYAKDTEIRRLRQDSTSLQKEAVSRDKNETIATEKIYVPTTAWYDMLCRWTAVILTFFIIARHIVFPYIKRL